MAEQSAPAQKRYAIKNHRPGESFHTPGGFVNTDPIDGGARLTNAQKKYFEEGGEVLVLCADFAPEPPVPMINADAAARVAENKAIADSQALEDNRVAAALAETVANEAAGVPAAVAAAATAAAAAAAASANKDAPPDADKK